MKNKKIIFPVLTVIILFFSFFLYGNLTNKIEVRATKAIKGNLDKYVEESGEILLDEQQIIYAGTSGYISDIYYKIGDKIIQGNKVLDINSSEVKNKIINRNKIQEEIDIAQRNLEDDKIVLDNKLILKNSGALSQREYTEYYNLIKNKEGYLKNLKRDLYSINNLLSESNTRIVSPLNGLLLDKYVEKGEYVSQGTPLIMIGDTDSFYVEADILTSEIKDIKEGIKVFIENENIGIDQVEGVISSIYPVAFSKVSDLGVEQNRVKVTIDIIGNSNNLKPGYDVDLKIITDKKENVVYIPESAVFQLDNENYVFLIENEKAVLKKIIKGIESDGNIEIIEGVIEGESIIKSPPSELEEGNRLILQ